MFRCFFHDFTDISPLFEKITTCEVYTQSDYLIWLQFQNKKILLLENKLENICVTDKKIIPHLFKIIKKTSVLKLIITIFICILFSLDLKKLIVRRLS